MTYIHKLNLQLFGGEGAAGDGGGTGATTGDNGSAAAAVPDAGEQRLRELGVPDHVLNKRANRKSAKQQKAAVSAQTAAPAPQQTTAPQDAAAQPQTEEPQNTDNAPARLTWDQLMEDPEYNQKMQETVRRRLQSAKGAEENLTKLGPALEVLANKYGMDRNNMDYAALAKAISDDDSYYEDKALEMGVSVDVAKRIDQQERETARKQAQEQQTLQQQKFQEHIAGLERQGEKLKKVFPNFDLRKELQDPRFARMTSPSGGLSVEDAYYAIHRAEIQAASMQVAAQKTAQKMSNAIQAGQRRPAENGTSGKAASVTTFDYRTATKEQRAALKKRIYSGEKIYPGQH